MTAYAEVVSHALLPPFVLDLEVRVVPAYPLVDLQQGQCLLVFERKSDEVGVGGIRHGTGYWVWH